MLHASSVVGCNVLVYLDKSAKGGRVFSAGGTRRGEEAEIYLSGRDGSPLYVAEMGTTTESSRYCYCLLVFCNSGGGFLPLFHSVS